jgi:hypoxanthine phosphoribosyltransferase
VLAVLRQKRAVADQSGLNSRQRLDNLAGALAVAPGGAGLLGGGRVVLVDDLMTTGASLTEAARAVRAAVHGHAYEDPRAAVYAALSRADGGQRMSGSSDAVDVICAAVVAASPDSFEINRN